jgi:hypothetical protein
MSCSSSGHITKLKQSIFAPFDIYDATVEEVFKNVDTSNIWPNWTGRNRFPAGQVTGTVTGNPI